MKGVAAICLVVLVAFCSAEKARYDNYRVYTLTVANESQFNVLQEIQNNPDGYNLWTDLSKIGGTVDLMVPPHKFAEFEILMGRYQFERVLKFNNVQELIDNERPATKSRAYGYNWEDYYSLDVIYEWLDDMLYAYPGLLTNYVIGYSHENRPIRAVKLESNPNNPYIFIEGTIHAREWISTPTVTFILNELLTSTDPAILDMAANINWVFVPVLNVDGFEFTHTSDRMWRKTRYPHGVLCVGADGNRNFDFQWNVIGASTNPCSEAFSGPNAFSEVETQALRDFYATFADKTAIYLTFHSFGNYFLFAYGHDSTPVDNYDHLVQISEAVRVAIAQRFGTVYAVGNGASLLYPVSGVSDDWARGVHNTRLTFTYELRGNSFILPAAEIIPTGQETLDSVVALIAEARTLGYM